MPGFTVTRGLGRGASLTNLIDIGLTPAAVEKLIRGTR